MTKTLLHEEDDTLRHLLVYEESGFPDEDEWDPPGDEFDHEGDDQPVR